MTTLNGEDRCLLYVATKRAKQHLYLTCPLNAYRSAGEDSFHPASLLLEPIPSGILQRAPILDDIN